jgi:hypothetical protein
METIIVQLRCVMREFLTRLIMNYPFELFLPKILLLRLEVSII